MAEDSTRKLLKVFGVAVTDFEDRCQEIVGQARDAGSRGSDPAEFLPLLEGLVRSSTDVTRRLLEVTQLIVEQQNQTSSEVLAVLEEAERRRGPST